MPCTNTNPVVPSRVRNLQPTGKRNVKYRVIRRPIADWKEHEIVLNKFAGFGYKLKSQRSDAQYIYFTLVRPTKRITAADPVAPTTPAPTTPPSPTRYY
jgi:hypothetical protein